MPAANVRTYEEGYAVRVEGTVGVYNSILIPAKKGLVNTPTLISGETQLLELFTPNGKVEVGYNLAYYSALAVLQKTNKLWVTRIANDSLYGGALINVSGSATIFEQINETAPAESLVTFNVSGIADLGTTVTVADLQGGVVADLNGRTIVIDGVGTHTVSAVAGSVLTVDAISNDLDFTGTGTGIIEETADFATFDVNFGDVVGSTTTTIDVTGMSAGAVDDLDGATITLINGSSKFTATVLSISGTTVTLTSATDAIVSRVSTGYVGLPEITFSVDGVADGVVAVEATNISPAYVTGLELIDSSATITVDMNDGDVTVVTTIITAIDGTSITVDSFSIPTLPTDSQGYTPYVGALATGISDITAVTQTDTALALTSADQGEWSVDVRIEILTGKEVKEDNAFIINVFHKDNVNIPLESFEVTRIEGQKNGYGRNMFVDTVLEQSKYIRGFSNSLVDEGVLPAETVSRDTNGDVVTRTFINFVAGDDGDAVTDSDMIAGMDLLANRNSYPVSVFLDGGWTTPAYQMKLAQVCENRDDSFAVLSVPYELEASSDYLNAIVAYRKEDLNMNSSYAALYTSHVKITDKYNDRTIFVSPDGYAAAAINYSASNYEIWYPPAGFKRGRLLVQDVLKKFTDGDLDLLSDVGINPIRFAPGKGIAIWGQYTMSLKPSILDRINVRLLLNEVKPAIAAYLEHYLFELNTLTVRTLVQTKIDGYLRGVKARQGIQDFMTVCNDTNNSAYDMDNHILNVDVYIKPMHSIEYINLTTILSSSGIEFADLV